MERLNFPTVVLYETVNVLRLKKEKITPQNLADLFLS